MLQCVVTGANTGLGLSTVIHLARKGHSVVLCARSESKGEEAKKKVLEETGCESTLVTVVQLDLADQENIAGFRDRYKEKLGELKPIDRLILNAGIMMTPYGQTKQGLESQLGVMVVGHYRLTCALIDLVLQATAAGGKNHGRARIVTVSSLAHKRAKDIPHLDEEERKKHYSSVNAYFESKLGNMLMMEKLNRIFKEKNVLEDKVFCVNCHPGISSSDLANHFSSVSFLKTWTPSFADWLTSKLTMTCEQGSLPTVMATLDEKAEPGMYAGPGGHEKERYGDPKWDCYVNPVVYDEALQDRLYEKCVKDTGGIELSTLISS